MLIVRMILVFGLYFKVMCYENRSPCGYRNHAMKARKQYHGNEYEYALTQEKACTQEVTLWPHTHNSISE